MPFTAEYDRQKMQVLSLAQLREHDNEDHILGVEVKPGDRCFKEYERFMRMWKDSPSWTTVDRMLEEMFPMAQERAQFLAFLVFFNLHAMDYEMAKRDENGEVE